MTKAIAAKTLIGAIEVAPASEIARSGFCHTPVKANFRDDRFCQMGNLTAEGHAPGLELCRLLLANGFDPAAPLHIYRDGVLAMRIRSIGAGAALSVQDDATGRPRFTRFRART